MSIRFYMHIMIKDMLILIVTNIYVVQKVHDILRQAWDVEGSPFKGQPFDLSVVNVSPSGI